MAAMIVEPATETEAPSPPGPGAPPEKVIPPTCPSAAAGDSGATRLRSSETRKLSRRSVSSGRTTNRRTRAGSMRVRPLLYKRVRSRANIPQLDDRYAQLFIDSVVDLRDHRPRTPMASSSAGTVVRNV